MVNRPHESLSRCKSSLSMKQSAKEIFSRSKFIRKAKHLLKCKFDSSTRVLFTHEMGCSTLIAGISTPAETESLRKNNPKQNKHSQNVGEII